MLWLVVFVSAGVPDRPIRRGVGSSAGKNAGVRPTITSRASELCHNSTISATTSPSTRCLTTNARTTIGAYQAPRCHRRSRHSRLILLSGGREVALGLLWLAGWARRRADSQNHLTKEGLTNQRTVGVGCRLANGKQVAASRNALAIEALDSHDPPSLSEHDDARADVSPFAKVDPAHSISEEFFHARCDQRCDQRQIVSGGLRGGLVVCEALALRLAFELFDLRTRTLA